MIPRVLELQNFLSYGPTRQRISFIDYQLICFSGKNGNGKSALLDAMTWALWGVARKTSGVSRADEGLVHLGQNRMLVSFEFYVREHVYRVRREFAKTYGKNYSALDFELFNAQKNEFVSLTDKTIRGTQGVIAQTVGLDFDTFVNSVFLRQGQSNEFSKKSPKERKVILASILKLDRFEELKTQALEKCREVTQQRTTTATMYEHARKELEDTASSDERYAQYTAEYDRVVNELASCEKQRVALYRAREEVKRLDTECASCQKRLENIRIQEKQAIQKIRETRSNWRRVHHAYLEADKENDEIYRQQLYTQQRHMSKQAQELVACKERQLKRATDRQKRATQLEREYDEALRNITQQLKQYEQTRTTQFEKRRAYYHVCIQRSVDVQRQIERVDKQLQRAMNKHGAVCGLCTQPLDDERARHVCTTLKCERSFLLHRRTRLSAILEKLRVLLTTKTTSHHERTLRTHAKKLEEERARIHTEDPELLQLEKEYQQAEQELSTVSYDKAVHEKVQAHIRELEQRRAQPGDCDVLKGKRQKIKETLWRVVYSLRELRKESEQIQKHHRDLVAQRAKHAVDEKEIALCDKRCTQLASRKEEIVKMLGQLEAQRKRRTELAEKVKAYKKQLAQLNDDVDDYTDLSRMFGQDGIPALLIDEALPEIEQAANELLAHLSDSGTRVTIRSLRDLKRGGVRETLDIDISDSAGTRPYELFSGGEVFRIDFALRIAISQLLARRAGATLQTLIIDEGFGSQDEEGLSRLQDALYMIRQDFAKIIVVSHLAAFKESFPVHFVIDKQPTGSTVSVLERG